MIKYKKSYYIHVFAIIFMIITCVSTVADSSLKSNKLSKDDVISITANGIATEDIATNDASVPQSPTPFDNGLADVPELTLPANNDEDSDFSIISVMSAMSLYASDLLELYKDNTNQYPGTSQLTASGTKCDYIGKTYYYDDMISFIQSCENPDLDRQYQAYGVGDYRASQNWSCSGWVSAVLFHYPGIQAIYPEDCYTASVASFQNRFLDVSPDWTMITSNVAGTEYSSVYETISEVSSTSINVDNCSSAYNSLVENINSGKIKAGDIIIFYSPYGDYYCHAAIMSDRIGEYSLYGASIQSPKCLNPSTSSNAVKYTNVSYWFDINANHGSNMDTICTGYAIFRYTANEPIPTVTPEIAVKPTDIPVNNPTPTPQLTPEIATGDCSTPN